VSDSNNSPDDLGSEQPFVSHLIELRDRLIRVVIAIGVVFIALAIYPSPATLYDWLAQPLIEHLPKGADQGDHAGGLHAGAARGALPDLGFCGAGPVHA